MTDRRRILWTFVVTSAALFMGSLDNLVVTTALPSIRDHLHASLADLQWTVNAYTLTFAVLLLTGATLGDRFGRRRMFVIGLGVFTAGSAAAALAPGIGWLIAARAFQGVGAAIVIPLTLTLLSAAVPPARRGLALGAWGAVGGLAIAIGPLVGGAVVEGASWQWIFWLNVPIGVVLLPFAWTRLTESYGPATRLDLPGVILASLGLLGIVLGVVRGNDHGWTSLTVLAPMVIGALLVAGFVAWELRAPEPMLPMRLFRSRGFTMTNVASLLMFFGMFGSIFLLAQFLQVVQGYSPLQAGLRTLPWTAMPILVAPIAGSLSDRIGGRPLLAAGLMLQAIGLGWLAAVISPTVAYATLVPAFVVSGIGMSLFFAPVANVVLGSVRRDQEGIASGANNAIRELGGVFGIAVLGAVFAARGGYTSGAAFVSGLSAAVWVGAAAVAVAGVAALFVPRLRTATASAATPSPPPPPSWPSRPSPSPRASPPANWTRSASHRCRPGPASSRGRSGRAHLPQRGRVPLAGDGHVRVLAAQAGKTLGQQLQPHRHRDLRQQRGQRAGVRGSRHVRGRQHGHRHPFGLRGGAERGGDPVGVRRRLQHHQPVRRGQRDGAAVQQPVGVEALGEHPRPLPDLQRALPGGDPPRPAADDGQAAGGHGHLVDTRLGAHVPDGGGGPRHLLG